MKGFDEPIHVVEVRLGSTEVEGESRSQAINNGRSKQELAIGGYLGSLHPTARYLLEYGKVLARRGDSNAARVALEAAGSALAEIGARAYAQQAQAALDGLEPTRPG